MLKKLMITTLSIAALAGASLASAASYDFVKWTDGDPAPTGANGEQGFTTFTMADDNGGPVSLTATAWHYPKLTDTPTEAFVYLDGGNAGMGVCSVLDGSAQCDPSSDDNVSKDLDGTEVLKWTFGGRQITEVELELGAHDHSLFGNSAFEYRDGGNGQPWLPATTDAAGMVLLSLSGAQTEIRFRAAALGDASEFYIRTADVTSVPIPAAAWLFGSALIGLAGVARKRKLS